MLRKLFTAILAMGTIGIQMSLAQNSIPYSESFESQAHDTPINTIPNWSSPASDLSSITNWNTTSLLPTNCSTPISGAHTKVLKLNTEDGILTNTLVSTDINDSTIYMDTLIQFVPSETTPTTLTAADSGIKAAIFVDANTNLVVYHGVLTDGYVVDTRVIPNTNEVIAATHNGTNWVRLTIYVKAIGGSDDLPPVEMFQVRTNGQPVQSPNAYDDTWEGSWRSGTPPSISSAGTWFRTATDACGLFNALCFQGTGYLDDLVVTTVEPTFTPLSGPSSYLITVVTGSGGNSKTGGVSLASLSTFSIVAGGSTAIVYSASDWYRIASLTSNDVSVAAATSAKAYTQELVNVTADITNTVSFAPVNPGIVSTSLTNIPIGWLANLGYPEGSALYANTLTAYELYLLNADPYIAQTNNFRVTGIAVANRTNIAVTVGLQLNSVNHTNITGYLKLTAKNSLTNATWDLVSQATALNGDVFTNNGTCTYTFVDVISNRFYKAVIEANQ